MTENIRKLVGLAWVSPGPTTIEYRMYKLFEDAIGCLNLELVERDKTPVAWQWIKQVCNFPSTGVWYNEHPGIVWARAAGDPPVGASGWKVDWQLIKDAFRVAARKGTVQAGEIMQNEAVAYTPFLPGELKRAAHHDVDKRHPHIASTRTRRDFARLRAKYAVPDGWALDYLPEELIKVRYGGKKSYTQMWNESERKDREAKDAVSV